MNNETKLINWKDAKCCKCGERAMVRRMDIFYCKDCFKSEGFV